MAQPRVLILRAPGTNCDLETAIRLRARRRPSPSGCTSIACWSRRACWPTTRSSACRAGSATATTSRPAASWPTRFAITWPTRCTSSKQAGKLILGICNGFQVLIKIGRAAAERRRLRPAGHAHLERLGQVRRPLGAACTWPARSRCSSPASRRCTCPWRMPKASSCPRRARCWQTLDATASWCCATARELPSGGAIALEPRVPYPDNPNGSLGDVAGVCDATGRVCGLMPHPERHIEPTQHPRWTREAAPPRATDCACFRTRSTTSARRVVVVERRQRGGVGI